MTERKPIHRLEGIRPEEVRQLQKKGIETDTELWHLVGNDPSKLDLGTAKAAKFTKIPESRIIALLAADAARQHLSTRRPWPRQLGLKLSLALVLAALTILIGVLRGLVGAISLPWPLVLEAVVTSTRELQPGEVLSCADLRTAGLPPNPEHVLASRGGQIEGAIVARAVPAGQVVRRDDLLRQQVVATRDIQQGEIIGPGAVATSWSAYRSEAAVSVYDVMGQPARLPLRTGEIVTLARVNEAQSASSGSCASAQSGRAEVEGRPQHLLFAELAATPVPSNSPADPRAQRQLLRLPVPAGVLDRGLGAGDHVSLLFEPTDHAPTTAKPLVLNDVTVYGVERLPRATPSSVVATIDEAAPDGIATQPSVLIVEISAHDLGLTLPVLGASTVFVLQPPHTPTAVPSAVPPTLIPSPVPPTVGPTPSTPTIRPTPFQPTATRGASPAMTPDGVPTPPAQVPKG